MQEISLDNLTRCRYIPITLQFDITMVAFKGADMPTDQSSLATLIKSDLNRMDNGHGEWIDGAYSLCIHLVEARKSHPVNTEFGRWCEDNGFGEDKLNPRDRAAAIAMGHDPEALRACLESTNRTSIRYIYDNEFRLGHVAKTTQVENNVNESNGLSKESDSPSSPPPEPIVPPETAKSPRTKQPTKEDAAKYVQVRRSLVNNPKQTIKAVSTKFEAPTKMVSAIRKEIHKELEERQKEINKPSCRNTYQSLMAVSDELEKVKEDVENGASWWVEFDSYVEKTEEIIEQCKGIIDTLNSAIHNKNKINTTTTAQPQPHVNGNATLN